MQRMQWKYCIQHMRMKLDGVHNLCSTSMAKQLYSL
jgi:hypothetical protein